VIVLNALLQPRLAAKDVVADLEATPIFFQRSSLHGPFLVTVFDVDRWGGCVVGVQTKTRDVCHNQAVL
jgi:hypothetical protein